MFRFYFAVLFLGGLLGTFLAFALVCSAKGETHSVDLPSPGLTRRLLLGQSFPLEPPEPAEIIEEKVEEPPAEVQNGDQSPPTPTTDNAEDPEDLFERVFGRPRPSGVQRLVAPFLINDLQQGQIIVFISLGGSSSLQVTASTLLAKTQEYARPDIQTRLEALVDDSGNLTLAALQSVGLNATFSEQSLELRIEIPPNLRKTIVYGSGNLNLPPGAATALRPSNFSGFVNLVGAQPYTWDGNP